MPVVPLTALPDDARVWVFAASEALADAQAEQLLRSTDAFLAGWQAHGAPLACAREWRDGRFLCIAVDQSRVGASGCSIDGLFRTLRELEPVLGTSMVAGGQLFWRDDNGVVQRGTRPQFAAHAASGAVRADTPVFDVTVTTLGDWHTLFERPAASSWHARYLASATESSAESAPPA